MIDQLPTASLFHVLKMLWNIRRRVAGRTIFGLRTYYSLRGKHIIVGRILLMMVTAENSFIIGNDPVDLVACWFKH